MFFLLNKLITIWVQIRDVYLYFLHHAIVVNGYVDDHTCRGIVHRNWGDDLNYYFLKEMTRRPVIMYHNFKYAKLFHLMNYMCIGTILDNYASPCNSNTVVWGSGTVGVKWQHQTPSEICSVRGPLTYKFLKEAKVNCPEVYGDPALLLPLVYQPEVGFKVQGSKFKVFTSLYPSKKVNKDETMNRKQDSIRYRLGIIPHVVDLHHPVIEEIRDKYADKILIIDLANYKKWTDVIDQICSCDRVLSSSLHGLITSDAYQVPSCWIELSGNISGGYFKFHDYASSVDRDFSNPLRIEKLADISEIVDSADKYFSCAKPTKIKELQDNLIKVAPFKLTGLQRRKH